MAAGQIQLVRLGTVMAPRRPGRPFPHRVRGNISSGMTQEGGSTPLNNQHQKKNVDKSQTKTKTLKETE